MSLAVTGSESHSSTSVPDIDCLCSLETAALAPGELAFVQDTKQFYYFDPDSTAVVDGVEVVCAANNCGRWIRTCINCNGPTGTTGTTGATGCDETCTFAKPSSSVMMLADLASINTSVGYVGGEWAFVRSLESYFTLLIEGANQASDGITVLDALGTPGAQWVRDENIGSLRWANQQAWYVDPVAGDDQYDGATPATALRTMAEWSRRMKTVGQENPFDPLGEGFYTIFLLNDVPSTDRFTPSAFVNTNQNLDLLEIDIVGQRTTVATGTFTAVNPTVGNTQSNIDAGIALTPGQMIVVTSGANAGSTAWVVANLVLTSVRVSEWFGPGAPAIGDTFDVVTSTSFQAEVVMSGAPSAIELLFFDVWLDGGNAITSWNSFIGAFNCFISRRFEPGEMSGEILGGGSYFKRAPNEFPPFLRYFFGIVNIFNSAIVDTDLRTGIIGHVLLESTVFQNGHIINPHFPERFLSAQNGMALNSVGFFDADASSPVIQLQRNARLQVSTALYGTNPLSPSGLSLEGGSAVVVVDPLVPTLSAAVEINFSNGEIIPSITAATGVPAAGAAISTWAQWNAAPYTRDAMNLRDATRIVSSP